MALYEETKRLQQERDAKFPNLTLNQKSFSELFAEKAHLFKNFDYETTPALETTPVEIERPKSWERNLGRFYNPVLEHENLLAEQQSGWARMGSMFPRIAIKTISEVAQLPGYLGGAVAWGLHGFDQDKIGMMVDNFWQRVIQGVEENVKDGLPVYTSDVVKNGNLLRNIFSTAFWANEGADGIGFLLAFLAPGAALRGLGFGAKAAKLIKPGTVIAKAGKAGQATETLTAAGLKLAGNIDDITSTIVNTLFESAAEGGETYRNILHETGDKERAAEAAVDVVQKNFGILAISNYIDQKWLFGKSGLIKDYAVATKGLAKGSQFNRVFSTAIGEPGKLLDAVAKRTTWNQIGNLSKTIASGFVKEGFWEEGMQFAVSKRAEEDYTDDAGFLGELADIAKTYVDNLSDVDMQKSIFLGGVLGSVMSGVSTVRNMKSTDRMLGNFHSLVKENNLTRYTSLSDLYVTDPETGNPIIGNDGKYQIDPNKAKEQLQRQFIKYIQGKQIVQAAKDGNIEAFEKIKDQRDLDYFLPFLQQQGGLEAAIYHINNLSETDMKWMKEEGVPIDVEQTKKELIDKVVKFQKIYDRVSDTHDLNINVKYNKEDQQIFDNFSDLIKSIKIGAEASIRFSLDRVDALKKQLSNYQISQDRSISISSEESNPNTKLVEDLKQSLKENKDSLSQDEVLEIQKIIKNVEGHVDTIALGRKRLGELYDNKELQKEYESFKKHLETTDTENKEEVSNTTKAKKAKAAGLNSILTKLYDEAVTYESFEGNEIRHSGQIGINYRGEDGQLNTLTAEVIEPNSAGNLTLRGIKNEGFNEKGELVETDASGNHYLNSDNTIHYNGKTYQIEDSPVLVKAPSQIIEERKGMALISSIEQMIAGYKNGLESIEQRIAIGAEYRNELQDRINKLVAKEQQSMEETGTLLTKKGTERVQSVLVKRSKGKDTQQLFLTFKELSDEIENADALIADLISNRDRLASNLDSLTKSLKELKLSQDPMTALNKTLESLTEMSMYYNDLVTASQESLEGSKEYLSKLHNVLKGFHTSATRVLKIEDQVDAIRNRNDLSIEDKTAMISDLIATTFVTSTFTPEDYEQIATIQNTINKIQGNATLLQQNLLDLERTTEYNRRLKEGLDRIIGLNRTTLARFNKNYLDLAKKLGVLKPKKISKEAKNPDPEVRFSDKNFRDTYEKFITIFEADKKHIFLASMGINNWLVSTGNQKQAQSNDNLARWYNFVNRHAYKKTDGRYNYIFKTYTLNQVGQLDADNPIRQKLQFTVDESGVQQTYDQITDKNNPITQNDVKIVAFERSGKLLMVSKNGDIGTEDQSELISSSLPLATTKYPSGYERFSFNREKSIFYRKLNVTEDTATPLQKEAFETYKNKILEESRLEYENFRKKLIDGGQITLDISSINPGNKVTKNANNENALVEQDLLEATGLTSPKALYKKIHAESREKVVDDYTSIVNRTLSGTKHGLINGYWYLIYNNRYELIKPKTLGQTGSVDTIVQLLQYISKDLDKNNKIRNYINKILYSGTEGSPFQFYLDYEKGVKDFTGIVFGDSRISRQDLIEGKNLEGLKQFLDTKFWNFDKNLLNQNEFTEYTIVDGKVSPKVWEFEDGGYKGFLFSNLPEHNNKTKGTVYIKPRSNEGLGLAKDPQYENQSINFVEIGKKATTVETTNPDGNLVEKKPFIPFGQGMKKKESTEEKPIEKLTESQPFIPFGQKSPTLKSEPTTKAPLLTADEVWDTKINEERRNRFLKTVDGDLNKAKQNAYAAYIRVQKEKDELSREATQFDEYKRENLEAAKAWLKQKFPNIDVEIIDGLIDGRDWGRITKHATVLLSSIAAEGTGYHEGFHLFSQLVLSNQNRVELYDEVKRRLDNQELTDKQAEEILAEEFRIYMMSPESYDFDRYAKQQKTFFEKLLDFILNILGINKPDYKGDNKIEMVFDILKNGEFGVYAKELPSSYSRVMDRTRVKGLSDKETVVFTRDINYRFFDTLFDSNSTYADTHLLNINTEQFTNDIYDDIKDQYADLAEINGDESFYAKIINHFDAMKNEHQRFLKQYNIETRNIVEDIMDEEMDSDENEIDRSSYAYRDPMNIDLIELIDNPVRMLVAGLPSVVQDSKLLADLTEYKTRSTVRFNRIMRLLNENLANLGIDFNNYVDKLVELSEKYPELNILLDRLRVGSDNISKGTLILRNQFVRVFAHHMSTPLLTNYKNGGVKNTFDAKDQDRDRLIRTKWRNNARISVGYKASMVTKNSRGAYTVNTQKLQTAIKNANSNFKDGSKERLEEYLIILKGLGITVAYDIKDVYNYKIVAEYINRLTETISARKGNELLISDLFNPDVIKNQKETRALVDLAKSYFLNDTDLSFYNQDGNKEFPINLHSHTTDTVDLLNRITYNEDTGQLIYPEEAEYLMPWNGEKGNLFIGYSYWQEHQKTGGKLKVVDLKGIIDQTNNKNSSRISNATFGDYKSVTFNALLSGIYVQMRSADRRRELGFMLTDENGDQTKVNYAIDKDTFKRRMTEYLKDELNTSFSLLIESQKGTNLWGNNLNNYKKNARELRVFKFLYDKTLNSGDKQAPLSLEEFINELSIVDNRNTVDQANELTAKYLVINKDYIDRSFGRYIDRMAELTEKSLKEDKLVEEKFTQDRKHSMGIHPHGLDKESLIKMGIKPHPTYGFISRTQLDQIVLFANYTSFIGNMEQLKYIMGDLAMWDDTTDFHKRVNGATSPKNKLADSKELRQQMDELYHRVDGKVRGFGVDIVVIEDIISSNKTLGKLYDKYYNTTGTDAQSYALLDEYRDIMIRNGLWYDHHEKTYQYEMQNFVLRLLKLKKNRHPFLQNINKQMFTDPDGIFYEHTKGEFPTEAMFNGKVLSETELGVLTIQKPQGFGHIGEVNGLNAPQFFKTSTAPLFPSSIENESKMLDVMLTMMNSRQGILAFKSSMKGAVVGNQNIFDVTGAVPAEGYLSQELKYADFGLQLDISEEEKGKVTVSTQRTKLEFIDVFSGGDLVGHPDLATLKTEYDALTNEIIAQERQQLLKDFGLVHDETNNRYTLTEGNKQIFKDKLINSFNFALLPYNIVDGIDLALDSVEKVFDMTVNKGKIEEVITSMVRRNIISRKTKGEMLVQESSVLYDQSLEFYRVVDGKVLPMDIIISLPLDLIPVMKRVGGLQKLNEAIAEKNTKLLGEDFFKILDIPMNRIPGQSMSSLDVGRVKKFLPYYHGSKVILPPEIVTKAGSDFDVDKMTSYFHYYDVKDGHLSYYNAPELNLQGKKNRLNDIAIKATLHPSRFNELVKPLTSDNVKELTAKYTKDINRSDVEQESYDSLGKNQNKWQNAITWWYNMQKGYEFFRAKKGTAIAAVHNAANAFSQSHPVRMKALTPLFFKGHKLTPNDYYGTGFVKDSDGYSTSRNFGEFLSAFVDVVKDPFVFDLTDSNTFNTIAMLNRYGNKKGIGLETIVAFMTQPAIVEYLRVRRENSAKFLSFDNRLNFEKQYAETVERLKIMFSDTDVSVPSTYGATATSALNQLLSIPNEDYNATEIKEASKLLNDRLKNYKEFSKTELKSNKIKSDFKSQVQILDNFMTYQILAQKLVTLNLMLRPDARSSMQRHLSSVEASITVPQVTLFSTDLFNYDDFLKAIGGIQVDENTYYPKTLLTEFYRTQSNMNRYFGDFFIAQKDPDVNRFFNEAVIPYFSDPIKWKSKKDIDKALMNIESDMMNFIIADSLGLKTYKGMQNWYSDLFVSENSVPKELLALKSVILDNVAISELEPSIAERITKTRTLSETDNISLYNKNFNVQELDAIEADLYALGVEPNDRNKKFVHRLMMHSIFQSGFNNAANSYMSIVPNRIFIDVAERAVGKFMGMSSKAKRQKLDSFFDQFFRNNASNTAIVPRHPWKMQFSRKVPYWYKQVHLDKKNFYKGYNYISFNYITHSPFAYYKAGQTPPMGVVLYRRVGNTTNFEVVSKQGDGIRMKEYYPMLENNDIDNVSIIESSRYNKLLLDVVYAEEENPGIDESTEFAEDFDDIGENLYYFDANKLRGDDFTYLNEGQKNGYYNTLGRESSVHRALRMIEANSTNEGHRKLAKVLKNSVKTNIPLSISKMVFEHMMSDQSGIPDAVGIYDSDNRKAYVFDRLDDTGFEVALLHEAMHALTHDEINKNSEFKARIQKIADHAYDQILKTGKNRDIIQSGYDLFADPHEFVSHAFTNGKFQSVLAQLEAENPEILAGKTVKVSVLAEFMNELMNLIKRYFNAVFGITQQEYNSDLQAMESVLKDLIITIEETMLPELTPQPIINEVGEQVNPIEDIKVINRSEQAKESDKEFAKMYPEYSYLNSVEQEALQTLINQGKVQLVCGI